MARINTALTFEFAFSSNGVAADGLTVTADIRNPAGTEVVTDGACTGIGDGRYRYSMSAGLNNTFGNYSALGKCPDTSLDQQHIPALIVVDGEISLPATAPAEPYTEEQALGWLLGLAFLKRTQTSSEETVYADDDETPIATSEKSDTAGTFTRERYS